MATPETRHQLLVAVAACDDKKGEDTRILELDPADSGLADFFLITSASNDRQVVAIADEIEFRLKKEFGLYATSVEGRRQGEWILLDYVDIVIHVFLAEKRAFYDIERLRKSARPLTPAEIESELKSELARKTLEARKAHPLPASKKSSSKAASKATSKGDKLMAVKKQAAKAPAKAAKSTSKAKTLPAESKLKKLPGKTKPPTIKAAATKAAKSPAKKSAAAPAIKKAAKKTVAKKSAKSAKAGTRAPRSTAQLALGKGAKPPVIKNVQQPAVGMTQSVMAPGAKPPIVKAEAPDEILSVDLAASQAPTPGNEPAKAATQRTK
jgi:ribosome-associated protein